MIFTNADWQIRRQGDTIVTMERVREAIAFNVELADESTWLWLTSEQTGFPLRPTRGGEHEERAEDLDSSQGVHDHLVAYHLAPAIADFISDENPTIVTMETHDFKNFLSSIQVFCCKTFTML